MITFETKLFTINGQTILHLPEDASAKLPSRGTVMVAGTVNDVPFTTLLEPDGKYGPGLKPSHWLKLDAVFQKKAHAKAGSTVKVVIQPTNEWVNPELPTDMKQALVKDKNIHEFWNSTTPLAKWDWVRWVRAVKTAETRQKHINVMIDKLKKGMRRPCCFNRNLCSDPTVSKNWVLSIPEA